MMLICCLYVNAQMMFLHYIYEGMGALGYNILRYVKYIGYS